MVRRRTIENKTHHLTPGSTMAVLLTILLLAAAARTTEAHSGQWKLGLVRACRRHGAGPCTDSFDDDNSLQAAPESGGV